MTTLATYIDQHTGQTWIGWDCRITASNGFIVPAASEKFRHIGKWWIGLAGSPMAMDILAHEAVSDIQAAGENAYQVVKAIFATWQAAGFRPEEEGCGPVRYGQYMLLVRPGRILSVSSSGAIAAITDPFMTEGSGGEYAAGAIAALYQESRRLSGRQIIGDALEIAARFDNATGPPFTIKEVTE
jgi:ATP-dependent protease HslVU (ClpYQ) peptidase subunit